MPANSWPENDSYKELWSDLESDDEGENLVPNPGNAPQSFYEGRRRKAAIVLTVVWSGTIALHFLSWGTWLVLGFTGIMVIHAVRVLFAQPSSLPVPLSDETRDKWPFVSLLVSAKNEEAVIDKLVEGLCNLDYPYDRYELWVIDDASTDSTPELLDKLQKEYPQLKVLHRNAGSSGGKSGALNQVIPLTKGEFLAIFDADASVNRDLLRQVLPLFERPQVGAVQVRKAVSNPDVNFWTGGQVAEMALDSFFQQQRTAIGGIGELRGNGEFIRRSALLRCGGFNEETITDDLDLTVRLHLDGWDIDFTLVPVYEEGVTNVRALWHQRNRWAEGGHQRYLDYWPLLVRNRLGFRKSWDMLMFWIIQYFLPMAAVPDSLMAVIRQRLPVYSPISTLMLGMSLFAMFSGLRRIAKSEMAMGEKNLAFNSFAAVLQTLRGMVYMLHWIVVMASVTARMSIRQKRLKWVKTVHQGKV
ncbi:MAG TPA: glycosyltransferase family 2 protein [Halomicronema sp.]